MRSRIGNGHELTDDDVDEMAELFYRCTICRRCSLECPMGLDHGLVTRLGRYILSMAGIAPKALQVSVREQLEGETHNTSKIPKPAFLDTLEFLAEEWRRAWASSSSFPVDQHDREQVFFCAVSDYLMEPDTLMGNAAVLYAAGDWDSWTIGSANFDGINYGLFYSDWHLERIIKQMLAEVTRLRGRKILIGECGHASRTRARLRPGLRRTEAYPVQSFIEYTLDCLERGKIRLDPDIVWRAGDLSRSLQHGSFGLDRGAAAPDPEIVRQGFRGDGAPRPQPTTAAAAAGDWCRWTRPMSSA